MNNKLLLVERMIMESLSRGKKSEKEISEDTKMSTDLIKSILPDLMEKKIVIYRHCRNCRRAAQRFRVVWAEPGGSVDASHGDDLRASAIRERELEEICDACKLKGSSQSLA